MTCINQETNRVVLLNCSLPSPGIGPKLSSPFGFEHFCQATTGWVGWGECNKDHNLSEIESFEDPTNESIRKHSAHTVIPLRCCQAKDMYLITR
jgi:hypothetical protein